VKKLIRAVCIYWLGRRPSASERKAALKSLRGNKCPLCGKNKRFGMTTCMACWETVPMNFRVPLTLVLRRGYVFAFQDMVAQHKRVSHDTIA
jgi:hypothetical protein